MGEAEGRRLAEDVTERLDAIITQLDRVESRAPERLTAHRDRLRASVRELTEQVEVDEDRLAREIAYPAARGDINAAVSLVTLCHAGGSQVAVEDARHPRRNVEQGFRRWQAYWSRLADLACIGLQFGKPDPRTLGTP